MPRTWRGHPPLPTSCGTPIAELGCVESGDEGIDGDDEMGGMSDPDVMSESENRAKKKEKEKERKTVLVENKVRWQDAWGTGPGSRLGGSPQMGAL